MAIKLGLTDIVDAKLGTTQVDKIYLGSTEVWSNAPTPTIKALKFTSADAQTLSVNGSYIKTLTPYFEYSLDDGTTWTAWEPRRNAITPISFGNGTDLYLRGTNTTFALGGTEYVGFVFSTSSPVSCSGNIMHLLDYTQDLTTFPTGSTMTFRSLFANCPVLTSAPDLPATTLVENCYRNMFYGCSGLTSAPALPATTLTSDCYSNMFYGSGLVNAPELPATGLAYRCYSGMFQNCSSLISAPALPATTLAERCYGSMFQNCTSLTQIPSLSHIDTVQSGSIRYMFYGCTDIKMSTTQDAEYVNTYTFGVTPTTTLAEEMFTNTGGTFTGTPTQQVYYTSNSIVGAPAPAIKALKFTSAGAQTLNVDTSKLGTLTPSFEYSLDNGATWTSWNPTSAGATPISFGSGTDLYLRGMNTVLAIDRFIDTRIVFSTASPVACSGNVMHLFDYTQDLSSFPTASNSLGIKYLFNECTVLTTAPDLPATTLVADCYMGLFNGCTSLVEPPVLPATVLQNRCYYSMFYGCTALTKLPYLGHLTNDVYSWGNHMFNGCSLIKMSETQTGEYQNAFTFGFTPYSSWTVNMFANTGGTFTGTPTKATYYTSNPIIGAPTS